MSAFNSNDFEKWLRNQGICWNHLNTKGKREIMKKYVDMTK